MYYPKSQIKTNLYTNGKEFQIESSQQEYKGYYFITSKQEAYTGKTPQDKPNNRLSPISSLSGVGLISNEDELLSNSYYLINDSYYNANRLSTKRAAPRTPIQTLGKPTDKDIQNGFFNRYFVKKGNEFKFIEVSKEEHLKFQNQDTSVQW